MSIADLLSDAAASDDGRRRWLSKGSDAEARACLVSARTARGAGRHGAIACGSPHATRIGMEVLRAGGTAADAAVAAGFAMMVADPPNASPAGRGHVLWSKDGMTPLAIDGATFAPAGLPRDLERLPDEKALPVPGIVRALLSLHRSVGSMPLGDLVKPARDLAAQGFEVPEECARVWAWRAPDIVDADARRVYLPEGRPVPAGAVFRNPGVAGFLDRLIATGQDPFADPDYAQAFCNRLRAKGAYWSTDDLTGADPLDGETVALDGPGWRLTSIGSQGWGHTLLRIVGLVESAGPDTPCEAEIAHLLAILCAFEERPEELRSLKPKTDPLPWEVLNARLSEPLTRNWRAPSVLSHAVDRARAVTSSDDRDTTHLSVIDRSGMRVALTQSIGPHFGARVADPETGILIAHSYRMAQDPTPCARDVTEQCPSIFDHNGNLYALGGAGSERIPGAVAAVIRHLLSGRDLGAAMVAPRSNWVGDTARLHIDVPTGLETLLTDAGATVVFTGRGPVDHLGIVQAVVRSADGTVEAAADPAYSGTAAAE